MAKGTIKKIIFDKGFGFITDGEKDVFFHRSSVEGCKFEDLYEGDKVDFNEEQGPKGPNATNVTKED